MCRKRHVIRLPQALLCIDIKEINALFDTSSINPHPVHYLFDILSWASRLRVIVFLAKLSLHVSVDVTVIIRSCYHCTIKRTFSLIALQHIKLGLRISLLTVV